MIETAAAGCLQSSSLVFHTCLLATNGGRGGGRCSGSGRASLQKRYSHPFSLLKLECAYLLYGLPQLYGVTTPLSEAHALAPLCRQRVVRGSCVREQAY